MKWLGFANATLISICLALDLTVQDGGWMEIARAAGFPLPNGDPFRMARTGGFADVATAAVGLAISFTLVIALLTLLRRKFQTRK
jgi:hypothetical protein